jgi:two-component system, cell cycle response regulator
VKVHVRWRSHVPFIYMGTGAALLIAYSLVPASGSAAVWKVALYCVVSGSAAGAVLAGILIHRPTRPLPWLFVLANQVVYAAGDVTYYVRHDLFHQTAYPSISDVLYLAHYPPLILAALIFIRRRSPGSDRTALIDAAVLAVTCVMLSYAFVIAPSFDAPGQDVLSRLTSAAYPTLDIVVLSMALWLLMGSGRRTRSFRLLGAALLLLVATDTTYALAQILGITSLNGLLDGTWAVYYLLIGAAFLDPSMTQLDQPSPAIDRPPVTSRFLGMGVAALAVPAVLVFEHGRDKSNVTMVVAASAAVLFALVFVRVMGMLRTQRRFAITDMLTGLPNRRYFETQLQVDGARAERSGQSLGFVLLDLDHFKSVNDTYGHPTGDQVLMGLAERLRNEIRAGDVLARYGGEEFALLLLGSGSDEALAAAQRLTQAVGSRPFTIDGSTEVVVTVSAGVVSYPHDVDSAEKLASAADRALYAAKRAGRDRIVAGRIDPPPAFLRQTLSNPVLDYLELLADAVDRYQAPVEHGSAMARWAVAIAYEMGLGDEAQRRCGQAARLHDIGKIAVPDAILEKEGGLTPDEWALVKTHPAKGELIVAMAPGLADVAEVILQHHERVDGAGYPRGLHEDEIWIEARVLSVCDTFAAMRASRPYHAALSEAEARDQLCALKGTQLSKDVVDVFVSLLDRGVVGHLGRLDPRSQHLMAGRLCAR